MNEQNSLTLITRDPARFDPLALDQLEATSRLEGMDRVVGLPDLHAGNGIAVGAAFWSQKRIWPHLVGSDIGCGMAAIVWAAIGRPRRGEPRAVRAILA